jgi:uncharacterized C2H2 Zn-finger protein
MVLRCPGCSELEFFGRAQVLGELVVCPRCETVFSWRDAAVSRPLQEPREARDSSQPKVKP